MIDKILVQDFLLISIFDEISNFIDILQLK